MQVKAGIEFPRRVSCSSASSDTEAHSDCQKRPDTACIRVSQGGRDGLATADLLKLKRGQDFRPRGRKKLKPREQIGVPFKAPWSLTRADPSKQPSNAFKTDTSQTRGTQNPITEFLVPLTRRYSA